MRWAGRLVLVVLWTALLVACSSLRDPRPEDLGTTKQGLLALGAPCVAQSQCNDGLTCVDGVCCENDCFGGQRDNWTCSNIYGPVPALVAAGGPGHCVQLSPGDPCGALITLNPCAWKGDVLGNGNNCPAPNAGAGTACYPCTSSALDCSGGLAVCNSGACVPCSTDNGSGGAGQCPTTGSPACVNGACVQCSTGNTSACAGSCDTVLNTCTGCNGDYQSGTTRPCLTSTRPICKNPGDSGACVECSSDAHCSGFPSKPYCDQATNTCVACTDSTQCTSTSAPVCSTGNVCTTCAGDFGQGTTSDCPDSTMPVCVAGACKQCADGKTSQCTGATPYCKASTNSCVGCLSDANCPIDAPFCDPNTNACINTCTTNAQCTDPTKPICNAGKCVQCTSGATGLCVGDKPYCSTTGDTAFTCVGCLSSANCGGTKPVCSDGKVCVACNGSFFGSASNKCPTSNEPACDPSGACFECVNNANCSGTEGVCNTTTHQCVECTATFPGACVGNEPVCNTTNNTCVACNGDFGSAATFKCPSSDNPACVAGSCVQCSGTNVTRCPTNLPVCDTATSQCVQCNQNADCTGANGICNTVSHTCTAGCSDDSNCVAPNGKCKLPGNICVECLSDAQCGGTKPKCNLTTNQCVACTSDAQCSGTTPICNAGQCVPCDGDRGSGTPNACKGAAAPACVKTGPDTGKCTECTDDNLTLCTAQKPVCSATNRTCVQCTSNAECSGATPICNVPAGQCVACNGDTGSNASFACPAVTPAMPACLTSGAFSGSCAQCSATSSVACTGNTPVCKVAASTCVECLVDAHCTGANGKCNTVTNTCTTGCTSDANCPSPATPACKLPDGFCVECTATNTTRCVAPTPVCDVPATRCVQCTKGSDCPASAPVCDVQTKTCVSSCTDDSQCPSTQPICDPKTRQCVECVDNTDCKPGEICNTQTNTCGTECSKSSECPGDVPVCNPQTKKCVECTTNADCPPEEPICDTTTNTCGTTCTKDSECPGEAPICDPKTKNCVQCIDSDDCTPAFPVCNPTTRRCEELTDDFSIEGAGCACSTVPSGGGGTLAALGGLGFVATAFARRRRRR